MSFTRDEAQAPLKPNGRLASVRIMLQEDELEAIRMWGESIGAANTNQAIRTLLGEALKRHRAETQKRAPEKFTAD